MTNPPSDAIVFFGATGDLAHKQIFPALLGLVRDEGLNVPIIGMGRAKWSLDQLKARAADSVAQNGPRQRGDAHADATQRLLSLLHYVEGDYSNADTFNRLRKELGDARRPLHYLAVPPSMFATVANGLATSGCATDARLVIEKPFGHNRATARTLSRLLDEHFPESSIFRIDHYLGKEPVQNILYTRFANSMFEPIWNRDHVSMIQITMAEDFGVQDRGRFYDETGAIRDVVQNHMLQVLTANLDDGAAHRGRARGDARLQKAALLKKRVRPLDPGNVVRGQYAGYQAVGGVRPGSGVETFVAVRLFIETWRWAGVPIYIRAGKKLPVTATEVTVHFKRPPCETFEERVPTNPASMRDSHQPGCHHRHGRAGQAAGRSV